tara:strand:- start:13 stop:393 length:381 start_codon:yes stop_codon:yes gene_type:complete
VFTAPLAWVDEDGVTNVFIVNDNGFIAYTIHTSQSGRSTINEKYFLPSIQGSSSPLLVNGMIFVQTNQRVIFALDPADGDVMWRSSDTGELHWQAPVVVNGHVYALDNTGYLRKFSILLSLPSSTS